MAIPKMDYEWKWWEWTPLLLMIPAYLINAGLMPLWADEPIRALVSLEMMISGNYLAPTIMSEWYLNKPPFYNWILVLFYNLFGHSEFVTRLPAMLSLIGMVGIIYWSFKSEIGHKAAIATGLTYITFGRMTWYSSHLGHIDPLYADLIFLNFIWIYRQTKKQQYWSLFIVSYFLAGICFLMKGLPTLAFQALTLVGFYISLKRFKKLFSVQHLMGIILFSLIIGTYYYNYFQYNISPSYYLDNLFSENLKRTAVEKDLLHSIVSVFKFPFMQFYLLLPFSLFIPALLNRQLWKSWWSTPFLKYTIIVVGVNIPIYILSPDVRPRYLFMLYPFIFLWIYLAYENIRVSNSKYLMILNRVLSTSILLLGIGIWTAIFFRDKIMTDALAFKVAFLSTGFLLTFLIYIKLPVARYLLIVIAMLLIKLSSQWIVLPYRYHQDGHKNYKQMAINTGSFTKGDKMIISQNTPLSVSTAYYITRERNQLIKKAEIKEIQNLLNGGEKIWTLDDGFSELPQNFQAIYSFNDPWENWGLTLGSIKLNKTGNE